MINMSESSGVIQKDPKTGDYYMVDEVSGKKFKVELAFPVGDE